MKTDPTGEIYSFEKKNIYPYDKYIVVLHVVTSVSQGKTRTVDMGILSKLLKLPPARNSYHKMY